MAAPDTNKYNDWLVKNYRFIVNIGKEKLGFSKVSGLEYSIDYDTIQEGGVNDRVHTLTRPEGPNPIRWCLKGQRPGRQGE